MAKEEWLTVTEYAEKIGKSRQQVYLDIRTGKIPKENTRSIKISDVIQIKYENK